MESNNKTMKVLSDYHVHTVASGHAFSTIKENASVAKQQGLKVIAITDHGPDMEHAPHLGYFENGIRVPREIEGVKILFGCESNIINRNGDIDIPETILENLDIVIAGIHARTSYGESSVEKNTRAIINTILKKKIDIIVHPYVASFPVSMEEIVDAACTNEILLEVNNSIFLHAIEHDAKMVDTMAKMVDLIQKRNKSFIVNSDAHYSNEIGTSEKTLDLLVKYLGVKPEYICNDKIVFRNRLKTK